MHVTNVITRLKRKTVSQSINRYLMVIVAINAINVITRLSQILASTIIMNPVTKKNQCRKKMLSPKK